MEGTLQEIHGSRADVKDAEINSAITNTVEINKSETNCTELNNTRECPVITLQVVSFAIKVTP